MYGDELSNLHQRIASIGAGLDDDDPGDDDPGDDDTEDGETEMEELEREATEAEVIVEEESEPWPEPEETPALVEEAPGDGVPVYLLEEPPEGKSNQVKWALMHDMTEADLVEQGFNASTVRICAQELEKDGYRQRPSKGKSDTTAVVKAGKAGQIQTFAKGSPPEALINAIELPLNSPNAKIFESGLKTGAALLVLGVRVAQELSAVGIQQAKPIMDMARSMREGEALAAKNAASEAAQEAAMKVSGVFSPHLASLEDTISDLKSGGQDPVQAMMVRTMEPMFQQMMRTFMPGLAQSQLQNPDWKVVSE
jgi:hypothetical protein